MTTIMVLAADQAEDALDSGYPVCLGEINGKPLLQHIVDKCLKLGDISLMLAVQDADSKRWHLDNVLSQLLPSAKLIRVPRPTAGAACTALLAVDHINNDEELLILNGNELIDLDYSVPVESFRERGCDGGVVVFNSIHPRYSYVREVDGVVVEAAEKNPISHNATAGFYWFKRGRDFVGAAELSILKNVHLDGRFYICPTLNQMILRRAHLGTFRIDVEKFHPLKSERQIERFDVR